MNMEESVEAINVEVDALMEFLSKRNEAGMKIQIIALGVLFFFSLLQSDDVDAQILPEACRTFAAEIANGAMPRTDA